MRNVYIIFALNEKTEKAYAAIVDKTLGILSGIHWLYSLSCTRTQIRNAFFEDEERYFLSFLAQIEEYGLGCHFHILIIAGETEPDEAFWRDAGRIISQIHTEVRNCNNFFSFCVFSALSRDQCIRLMNCGFPLVQYCFTNNDNRPEEALERYVDSVEDHPYNTNEIREINSPFFYEDEIPDKTGYPENKYNTNPNRQKDFIIRIVLQKDLLPLTFKPRNEIIIFSTSSEEMFMNSIRSILEDILSSRGMVKYRVVSCRTPGTFPTEQNILMSLVEKGKKMQKADSYALFLFTPDDPCIIENEKVFHSRDYIWLEYGLFKGLLGLNRVFALFPSDKEIKKTIKTGSSKEEKVSLKWHKPSASALWRYKFDYSDSLEDMKERVTSLLYDIVTEISINQR